MECSCIVSDGGLRNLFAIICAWPRVLKIEYLLKARVPIGELRRNLFYFLSGFMTKPGRRCTGLTMPVYGTFLRLKRYGKCLSRKATTAW